MALIMAIHGNDHVHKLAILMAMIRGHTCNNNGQFMAIIMAIIMAIMALVMCHNGNDKGPELQ